MSEESFTNYYEILGCDRDSTYEDLKQAYHELVLRYHPDKISATGSSDANKFRKIDEAWKILRDPCLRRQYDVEFKQAELEADCELVYAKLKPEELETTGENIAMSYPCRCGSSYSVNIEDLKEKNNLLHIYCEECTFMIIVET
ncbi:dnaJ homolog subfamily C member 24-like [Neodiprion virginianus]|uniref:dnaJ homolog subfamily C member 24-like n=1 Tax=Neodiprion virginianus TaxID=2961670 RepID=UPI001EE6D7E1|nr:dnaJ homolog subfamily C member 24-like [Neodiprion virginianus]